MKYNCWLIVGAMLSTSLLAQQATNTTPSAPIETPAPAPAAALAPAPAKTNAPAAKAAKKSSSKKKAAKAPAKQAAAPKKAPLPELKTVPLVPGPAEVVASNVNVRGQAKLKSEVIARVTKGQTVTVIEEIVRNNSGPEEPSAWAKIVLPPTAHAWVNKEFINAADQTVKPRKLNLRSGPGENYSVIGALQRGDVVKPIASKGDWTEIEPPAGAYAFMAAQYLKQELPATTVATTTTPPTTPPVEPVATTNEPPPTPTPVAAVPPVAPPPTEAPAVPPPTETPGLTNAPTETPVEPAVEEPPPPRIVQREGIVRGSTSIQAPSKFALVSPVDGRNMDYLFTTSTNLDLRRYKGLRIIVAGEEGLDERWPNTPVLTIQRIQVVQE
jgi:uncharacterized protein YgiM (DUF1202 family)